jgi:hypothetical protein
MRDAIVPVTNGSCVTLACVAGGVSSFRIHPTPIPKATDAAAAAANTVIRRINDFPRAQPRKIGRKCLVSITERWARTPSSRPTAKMWARVGAKTLRLDKYALMATKIRDD